MVSSISGTGSNACIYLPLIMRNIVSFVFSRKFLDRRGGYCHQSCATAHQNTHAGIDCSRSASVSGDSDFENAVASTSYASLMHVVGSCPSRLLEVTRINPA